jgi:hypothetical protein
MSTFLPIFLLSLAVIGLAVAAMAVGVMFKRPCLRGSCGGRGVSGPEGQRLSCDSCPNRHRDESPPVGDV